MPHYTISLSGRAFIGLVMLMICLGFAAGFGVGR